MTVTVARRKFIAALCGAAAWPLAARAQPTPVVGYLDSTAPDQSGLRAMGFRKGLSEMGYIEGRNLAIEYRYAQNDNDRLREMAADLTHRRVAVFVTTGTPAALAAKAATSTIPIVFSLGSDPVQMGLVASLNRPGGNVTGVSNMSIELEPKLLSLLHELVPPPARFGALVNPSNPVADALIRDLRAGAAIIGREVEAIHASNNRDIDSAFANLVQKRIGALLVGPDTFFLRRRVQLVTLAARDRVPVIYWSREFTEIGGLMSYGTNLGDAWRQAGIYTGRILKGDRPADLPVMRPTKFEFVLNLETARIIGIAVPPTLLAIADEVIE
jgi:putative ABC transport system substrate-binding protein